MARLFRDPVALSCSSVSVSSWARTDESTNHSFRQGAGLLRSGACLLPQN